MKKIRVLVWGDSIAATGDDNWVVRAQRTFDVSINPGVPVEFINIAQCGLAAVWGKTFFEEKVKPVSPDYVIIQFGFNDLRHPVERGGEAIGAPEKYRSAILEMVQNARSAGAEVLVIGNHDVPFGDLRLYPTGLNAWETLALYRGLAEQAAAEGGAEYLDMAAAMSGRITPEAATCDGTHLSDLGKYFYNAIISTWILKKILKKNERN